jgi:hypothetical protein
MWAGFRAAAVDAVIAPIAAWSSFQPEHDAEQECLADEDARQRHRLREEARRCEYDTEFQAAFATAIGELFPGCPPERAAEIAGHAGARRSGRVGRSAAGRVLDPEAVTLAVVASVRHVDTPYDRLLMAGVSRADARRQVADEVSAVIDSWRLAGCGDAPAATTSGETPP